MIIGMETSSGGGGSAPELVWVNNSPTSSFSAQTINESTTGWVSGKHVADYDGFIILGQYDTSHNGQTFTYIPVSTPTFAPTLNYRYFASASSSDNGAQGRQVSFSSGIVIGSNNSTIPLYIWGIKGTLSNS